MSRYGYQQKNACEEMVVCPKPRRFGFLLDPPLDEPIRPFRYPINCNMEMGDSRGGSGSDELLDIILSKGGYGIERCGTPVASSPPPYFCGSPPCRVSNPLIQDAQFGAEKQQQLAPASPIPSSPSSPFKGGCVRMKFGHKPAAVRIEGFDCLSRDGRNCSISALA